MEMGTYQKDKFNRYLRYKIISCNKVALDV